MWTDANKIFAALSFKRISEVMYYFVLSVLFSSVSVARSPRRHKSVTAAHKYSIVSFSKKKTFNVSPHIFLMNLTLCCHPFTQTGSLIFRLIRMAASGVGGAWFFGGGVREEDAVQAVEHHGQRLSPSPRCTRHTQEHLQPQAATTAMHQVSHSKSFPQTFIRLDNNEPQAER